VPIAIFMQAHFVARVQAVDPLAFGPPALLLVVVGLAASIAPARRASRVDPISTLRQE
jgi:ABC-type lipoprotein release transport system permease subunit